jgi:hypothetical protein
MTIEKAILRDIVNGLESLAVAVDAIEAILIRSNICSSAQFAAEKTLHVAIVANRLASLHSAVESLV